MEQVMEYQKSYREYKAELDNELSKTAEGFVRIGYLLKVARDTDILKESGYSTVTEFAKAEYNIDKAQVSRFIRINDKFSEGGYSDHLLPQYQGFGYAKLSLMLMIPDEINEELTPEYSKAEIQAIKEEVEAEDKITDIEVMLEEPPEYKDLNLITQLMRLILEDEPEKYKEIHEAFQYEKTIDDLHDILAPNGDKIYSVKIPNRGRFMVIFKGKDTDVVVVERRNNNEKTWHPWREILEVISWLIKSDISVEDSWRQQYDKEFPLKAEVAPVQPQKPKKESRVTKVRVEKPKTEKPKTEEPQAETKTEPETPKEQPAEPDGQTDVEQPKEETAEAPAEEPKENEAEDMTETVPKNDVVEKVEGIPLYVRRKYMALLTDPELAEYLKKELKPHIMLSAESILRWLQEEV